MFCFFVWLSFDELRRGLGEGGMGAWGDWEVEGRGGASTWVTAIRQSTYANEPFKLNYKVSVKFVFAAIYEVTFYMIY